MSTRKKNKRALRLTAFFLCSLITVSALGAAILFRIDTAAAPLDSYAFETEKTADDFRLAVGIRYGSSAYPLHSVTSPNGFVIGEAEVTRTNHAFVPLYEIKETDIAAVIDTNLAIGYESCEIAQSVADTDIGGYNVELALPEEYNTNIWDLLDDLRDIFITEYEHIFPAYSNGKKTLRVGAFPDYASASAAAGAISAALDGFVVSVASPSSTSVAFLNSDYDTVLFEYSGSEDRCVGISAIQKTYSDYAYLYYSRTSYLYDGSFCFKRSIYEGSEGLTMINLVNLQSYVEGVVPYEISSTWPAECLKAFSIMVRSFAMANLNRHYNAYGFDICSTNCCQVYQGRRLVTDSVVDAVSATAGQILVYGKSIVNAAYSSSQGGYSVASQYVWVSALEYLINQPTPWEDYCDVKNGLWEREVTEKDLATAFKNSGYSSIKGNKIVSISYETADDSPYLYSFTGVDEQGNSATATKTSKVKSLFGSRVQSANFRIAKGSLTYTYPDVLSNRIVNLGGNYEGEVTILTSDGLTKKDVSMLNFFTDLGKALSDISGALFVNTREGTAILTSSDVDIPVSTQPDENGIYTVVSSFGDFLIVSEVQDITKTVTASDPNSYVIVGMGSGHGVGASQYGTLHLAKAGATYEQIVRAYYIGSEIVSIKDFFG